MSGLLAEPIVPDFRVAFLPDPVEEAMEAEARHSESLRVRGRDTSPPLRPGVRSLQRWLDLNA